MKNKNAVILGVIFLLVLALRLFIVFQTDNVTYDAFFTLRNIEHIQETGLPLFQDDLSYTGRQNVFNPFYYYILAFFSFIVPELLILKLIPNIFAASIVFVVYLFAKRLSQDSDASLIAAGASGIIPVFFSNTINNASIYSLVIPLFFLTLYFFLSTVSDSKNLWKFLLCLILLTLTHASSLILAFGLLIYVVLLKVQSFKKSSKEPELLLFSLFLIIWANLTIYKQAISMHGASVIYQNTPVQLIFEIYQELTFVESLFWIGIIPLLFGVITIYQSVFSSRKKSVSSLIAICLTFFLLLWFRLIDLYVGLMFFGVTMSILSAGAISGALNYAQNIKFKWANRSSKIILIILILISFIPAIPFAISQSSNSPSQSDINAFIWLNENTEEDVTVLTLYEEGSAMSHYSERGNVIDENFLLIQNINVRFEESEKIYTERFLIPALSKLNYYSVNYVLISEYAIENRNYTALFYQDNSCINQVYSDNITGTKIYSVNCFVSLNG